MYTTDHDFALTMDRDDPLGEFRQRYHIPRTVQGEEFIYLAGNSLGLQPKGVQAMVDQELKDWAELGVEGHFEAKHPWYSYQEMFSKPLAAIVGAEPTEVVAMNTLTTNLHLMMVSFYRPTPDRHKIVIEAGAFPSDQYAVASQVRFHGFDPSQAIIELRPREGEDVVRTDDIERLLITRGSEIALVMLGGVNYYSGQAFDMKSITEAAHGEGCVVGYDLAHAVGNLHLKLHDWNVDFAVWCGYKYLNSGPGGVSGAFVHERHAFDPGLPRFAGWWGVEPATRFDMHAEFTPQRGAAGWQLSNAQILPMAAHKAAIDLFIDAGMERLRRKSLLLTGYLEFMLDAIEGDHYTIITPRDPHQRGCQLSVRINGDARKLAEELKWLGVIADCRAPDVIRLAPVPMYNTFDEVYRLAALLRKARLSPHAHHLE